MIDTYFELASNLLQVFIYTWFVTTLFGFKEKNGKSILMFVLTIITGFSILSFINAAVLYDGLLSGFVTLTVTLYSCVILKGDFFKKVFVNVFATAIIFTLASLAIFITSHISGKYAGYMISVLSHWRVIGVCFCRLFEYLIFRAIIKINMEYTLTKKEWTLFIALPAATWVALTFMTQAVIISNEILKYMFYIIFILILIDIVIIYFMFKMKQDANIKLAPFTVDAGKWGDFLCVVFDEWLKEDVGNYYIQLFDSTLANWVGEQPGVCTLARSCGHAGVMEFNGDVYACDHFVFPEYKLGNIHTQTLTEMMYSQRQLKFGADKYEKLPTQCKECDYLFACNGECPKNRFLHTANGEPGLNYLCKGYKKFFKHVAPYMDFMKKELLAERPPANVMRWAREDGIKN